VVLVELSRNFGMKIAVSAGLDHARRAHVVLMHAGLQDPPELIPDMLAIARDEEADVVFARRIGRDENRVKRLLATGFYVLMRHLAHLRDQVLERLLYPASRVVTRGEEQQLPGEQTALPRQWSVVRDG
jgi:glycosyltransferase involved in cell wall biosynthesis